MIKVCRCGDPVLWRQMWWKLPSWYLAVVHVGCHDDPRLAFVSLKNTARHYYAKLFPAVFFLSAESADTEVWTDPAVKNHDIVRVGHQPGLHRFTNSTNPVQRGGVTVRPAVVLHLSHRRRWVVIIQPSSSYLFNQSDLERFWYLWVEPADVVSLLWQV